jgi:hypothetical protein
MLNEPTHWEVWSMIDGALAESIETPTAVDADASAGALSLAYRDAGLAYEVFVLAHYCGGAECDCVQWLQDHRPRYSWNPSTRA